MSDTDGSRGDQIEAAPEGRSLRRGLLFALPVLLTLASLARAADLYRAAGLALFTEQFIAGMLAMSLPVVFLGVRARKGAEDRLPWYDAAAAVMGFAAPAYVAIAYPRLSNLIAYQPLDAVIVSFVILVLITEALRRAVGKTLVIMLLLFLAYAMWGHYVPGALQGRDLDVGTIVVNLALDPQALLGVPLRIGTTILFAFVFMGHLLFQSGGSGFFTDLSQALMGNFRGGAAKISVTASALFGSISGSAVSNVVSTGVVTIPMMRRSGYSAPAAAAIEAVASTGGQLMPPIMGVTAFVRAEYLEVPYADVVVAALVPAALYYAALLFVVDLEAARAGIAKLDMKSAPRAGAVFRAGWFFPLPFGVLIHGLFYANLLPETAALRGSLVLLACAVLFGYQGTRLGPRRILEALRRTGMACVEIVMITAAAGLAIGVLNLSGLSFGLTLALVQLGEGHLMVLLVSAAVVCIVLGMGMPTLGVYVLLAALVAPAIVEVGVAPMAAHLFVLYFGLMSMITPPIAIAAFAAATVAEADPMRTGFAAVRFGWLAYVVPFLFIGSPGLLLRGEAAAIVVAIASSAAGVWLMCAAVVGYSLRRIEWPERILFALAGAGLMAPASWSHWQAAKLAGLGLAAVLIARDLAARRRSAEGARAVVRESTPTD